MAVRKKWATRLHPGENRKTHPSQAAAYRYVQARAVGYRLGTLRRDLSRLTVFVDEGDGWKTYEVVNLAEATTMIEEE